MEHVYAYFSTQKNQLLFISFIWIISATVINPYGEFPFNDDWAYAQSVQSLVEKHKFFMSPWTSTNLVVQIIWGTLFCLPFGFSFTALRISTLAAGLFGLWGTHRLIYKVTDDSRYAFIGTLLMLANPMYLGLSASFMTDIPFYTLMVWSLSYMVAGLREDKFLTLLIGIFLAALALLVRQLGISLFVGFSFAYVARKGMNWKAISIGAISIAAGLAIQLLYQRWLDYMMPELIAYNVQANNFFSKSFYERPLVHDFFNNSFVAVMYTGVFMAPYFLLLLTKGSLASLRKNLLQLICLIGIVIGLWFYFFQGMLMPIWWNILNAFGLGPMLIRDMFYRMYTLPTPGFLHIAMGLITIGSILGSVGVLFFLIKIIRYLSYRPISALQRSIGILFLSVTAIYYLPMSLQGLFDRYLLPIPALLLILIYIARTDTIQTKQAPILSLPLYLSISLFFISFVYNICTTHDYLAWNRVRWQSLNNLLKQGVKLTDIDGGFEFNGWHLYNSSYKVSSDKSFWWVHNDKYVLAASVLPGFTLFQELPVNTWLPYGLQKLYIGKKIDDSNPQSTQ
ncbi:ArnT family glycosyltransferase [Spirosoma aerolatum]|uniref:ArnT family glycosyltransferase n=1 Tax=Spirosoma aerolatum TaxID=1211326 RepID=UPI0009AC7033|nr:glycosyltransferase family 39 protein [Spirosoma aerolatum]